MCGIAGTFGSTDPDPIGWLNNLRHRGPDGEGIWISPSASAALVHTRLAILDVTEHGAQPMGTSDGHGQMVFNGEIYNFLELKEEMNSRGDRFMGGSDTEVLLRLVKNGPFPDCLHKIAGMFAFGYWDEKKRCGLLARDPFGIKPLYYYQSESGDLHFASELKALRGVVGGLSTATKSKREFLRWGSIPEPLTLLDGVHALPAGHFLKWCDGVASIVSYRQIEFPSVYSTVPDSVAVSRRALEESIERHLISDVPLGIFLSGGIDSTAILALTRRVLGRQANIKTFSIGFENPQYDESTVAKRTADHFGTDHTEWIMTSEDGKAEVPNYLESMDQPTIDGFNTWCVSKLARSSGVKVVLSGLGGDELFGGYRSFARVPRFRRLHRWLGVFRPLVAHLLRLGGEGSRWNRLASFLHTEGTWIEAYHSQRGIFTKEESMRLVTSDQIGELVLRHDFIPPQDDLDAVSLLELTLYMRNQLLRDSDIFSMAHGLELRVPLVDIRLFDTISKIPATIRLSPGKQLLIDAVPEIPSWVRERPKYGFRFPFQEWAKEALSVEFSRIQSESSVSLVTWYRAWALISLSCTVADD